MAHDKILDELARLIAELQTATDAIGGAKMIIEKVAEQTVADDQNLQYVDMELFFANEIIGSDEVSESLRLTKSNVSTLFNKGLIKPARKIGRDWITTRLAVQQYQDNRIERRGNPLFGTVYKGRKPKEVETAQQVTE